MTPGEGVSEKVAEVLAKHPPELGELGKARGERHLLEAMRDRATPVRASSRAPWVAAGAIGLAAAAAILFFVLRPGGAPGDDLEGAGLVARFTLRDVEATSQQGTLDEGSTLATAEHQVADIRIAHSRIRIEPQSHLRIAGLAPERVDLELAEGEVRVEFHPEQRGREHLSVATPDARVEVVGTVFTVRASAAGTEVSVSEGVVRVVPRDGTAARRVRAGEVTRVSSARAEAEAGASAAPNAAGSNPPGILDPPGASRAEPSGVEPGAAETPTPAGTSAGTSAGISAGTSAGTSAGEEPPREPSPAERLAQARRFLDMARPDQAEPLLRAITAGTGRGRVRAEAWFLLADVAERASRLEEAAAHYEHAASEGRGTMTGPNAIYALARLQERRLADPDAARASYARYLEEAPGGPLAHQVTQALCRLGDAARCGAP